MLEFAMQRSRLASRAKTTFFADRQCGVVRMSAYAMQPQRLEEPAKAAPFAGRLGEVMRFSAKIASGDFGQ
jgi:hypothetical protein